jgi:uncharacterized membrane protein YjjP (DUF1212 family)
VKKSLPQKKKPRNLFMEDQDFKKLSQYSNASLVSSILLLVFGFGFGVVNMAFFLIALVLAGFGLARNKENIRSVKKKCISAIIIVLVAVGLSLIGFPGLIDFVINPSSLQKIDEITKPLF